MAENAPIIGDLAKKSENRGRFPDFFASNPGGLGAERGSLVKAFAGGERQDDRGGPIIGGERGGFSAAMGQERGSLVKAFAGRERQGPAPDSRGGFSAAMGQERQYEVAGELANTVLGQGFDLLNGLSQSTFEDDSVICFWNEWKVSMALILDHKV